MEEERSKWRRKKEDEKMEQRIAKGRLDDESLEILRKKEKKMK